MFWFYLLTGAFAGLMSGLFGIGGGIIVIPALAKIFLHFQIVPDLTIMHMAIGTSLAAVIFTTLAALYAHHKRNNVRWDIARLLAPGLTIGSLIGVVITSHLSSGTLRVFFSIFLFGLSVYLFFRKQAHATGGTPLPRKTIYIGSTLAGALSSMLGVGGGILLVPLLLHCKLDMRGAAGTSVVGALVVSIVATCCFIIAGVVSPAPEYIPWSTGYVYWPAFLGIILASVVFAPIGTALAHKLPREVLKRVFAIFIFIVACDMLFFTR